MAYLVRRLLENTSNESFLRAGFTEHKPEEVLLMNPLHKRGTGNGERGKQSVGSSPFPIAAFPIS